MFFCKITYFSEVLEPRRPAFLPLTISKTSESYAALIKRWDTIPLSELRKVFIPKTTSHLHKLLLPPPCCSAV